MKKDYYVFVGQNATIGDPNPRTGMHSFWGCFYSFSSKQKRDEWVEENDSGYVSEICEAVTRRSGRKYDLGISIADYNYHLDMLQYS